jgi:hypothetical protein
MTPPITHLDRRLWIVLPLITALICQESARAQETPESANEIWRRSIVDNPFASLSPNLLSGESSCPVGRVARIPMFGMVPAFLTEPLGLDAGDDPVCIDPGNSLGTNANSAGEKSQVVVVMGLDNPYFDYPGRNDFGGVGFYKVYSQLQLLDKGTTCVSLGLQAAMPAGIQAGGLQEGPTMFRPALAWFQELGDGTALTGFVSKTIRAGARWSDEMECNIHCGMALQYELPWLGFWPGQSVHLFMEALGRYRVLGDSTVTRPLNWDLIPGIHWRMGESWWLSVGAARRGLITCSWQF